METRAKASLTFAKGILGRFVCKSATAAHGSRLLSFDFWTRGPKIRVPVVRLRGDSNATREPQDACTRGGRGAGPGAQVRGSAFPDVRGKDARVSAHSRAPPGPPSETLLPRGTRALLT